MSGNKRIWIWFIAGMFLTACRTVNIPAQYNFTPREIKENPYGCWTNVIYNPGQEVLIQDTIAGELICIEADSIYILTKDRTVHPIHSAKVVRAELYTHKNQAKNYARITSIYLIPNFLGVLAYFSEYGGAFLAMGIPVALVGLIQTIIEGNSSKSILSYPEKVTLEQLKLFSRFPAGKPLGINLVQLKLKESSF